jgi:hypothetical protein
MTRTLATWVLSMGTCALLAAPAPGDVVVRGPFGGQIVVWSPSDVRVAPGGVVVVPVTPAPVVVPVTPAPPMSPPQPVPLPAQPIPVPLQQPQPAIVVPAPKAPVLPQDFARTFQPRAGTYDVVFIHPRTNQPVSVAFDLPAGDPRVSWIGNSLVFDYGRHEVEIRFQIGGRVKVIQR